MARRAALFLLLLSAVSAAGTVQPRRCRHDYAAALNKSLLFFEGQRSGRLPSSQRLSWRDHSALNDGSKIGIDLTGGYYDAGDNIKFGFPMAFSATVLSWGIIEFGFCMGSQLQYAREAVRWATDYLLKATAESGKIHVQVGDPYVDHGCWERPEDMDTTRSVYTIDKDKPGSEVAAETAAALAAASLVFKSVDPSYSFTLLQRSIMVFEFADRNRGSYSESLGNTVCPFYCDFSGYKDELVWAAAWMERASNVTHYGDYVGANIGELFLEGGNVGEFGWDDKHAGVYVLVASMQYSNSSVVEKADEFVCSVVPQSPTRSVQYSPADLLLGIGKRKISSPTFTRRGDLVVIRYLAMAAGGLMFKTGGSNMQHPTALSFLLVVYARHLRRAGRRFIRCGNVAVPTYSLIGLAKSQVDYILGDNPLNMSYMVGYGGKYPQRIHHRASSLPSLKSHPAPISCTEGTSYYQSEGPNPNQLTGAVVGGPNISDGYPDSRAMFQSSEPATYINAPLAGLLAFFSCPR